MAPEVSCRVEPLAFARTPVILVFMREPTRQTWPPRFLFLGGRLCIDLAHTGGTGAYAKFERLNEPSDLVDWLLACELGLRVASASTTELAAAVETRSAIWQAAQRIVAGRAPTRAAVCTLNDLAAGPDLAPLLRGGTRRWRRDATAAQAVATIARDAVELFGSSVVERLRQCQNPACPLLFVDASRPGKRAWCTMRRCGNLEKTARYRTRQRKDSR